MPSPKKVCAQDDFEVSGLDGSKGARTKKDLFEGGSPEPEMEKEQFHQAALAVGSEYLLQPVQT